MDAVPKKRDFKGVSVLFGKFGKLSIFLLLLVWMILISLWLSSKDTQTIQEDMVPNSQFFQRENTGTITVTQVKTKYYLDNFEEEMDDFEEVKVSGKHFAFSNIPSHSSSMGLTSIKTTTVRLVEPRIDDVKLGDILHFVIQSKDDRERPRPSGGDFWLPVLRGKTDEGLEASMAGRVIDHRNGSYSIYFIAAWVGNASIKLVLAMTAEAVDWFKNQFSTANISPTWSGIFINETVRIKTKCTISTTAVVSEKCVYRRPNALRYTSLVCDSPDGLPCDSLVFLTDGSSSHNQFFKELLKHRNDLFAIPFLDANHFYRPIVTEDASINIQSKSEDKFITATKIAPLCKPELRDMLSEGFWFNGSWHILSCRSSNLNSKKPPLKCLEGKNIILSGDSTTRQWYTVLNEVLGKPIKSNDAHIFNANIHYPENDINISFIFHPMSVHPHGIFVNLSEVYFEEELLHTIKPSDCEKTIIIISPWAHFVGWPWRAFLDYAHGIRKGVAYVRKVCPNLPIFLKSSHIIEHTSNKIGKDWLSRRISFTLRDILNGLRVNFLDIWDITLSSSFDIKMHMHKKVIIAELELFFQHLHC